MQLYMVHCGFYDAELCDGIYEGHVNFFVAAESFEAARVKVREVPEFKAKKMHVDGLQEIQAVDGHKIRLDADASLEGKSRIVNVKHRDFATKPAAQS